MFERSKRSLRRASRPAASSIVTTLWSVHSLDEIRRYEIGVEALCELITDLMSQLESGKDMLVPGRYVRQYRGIGCAAWGVHRSMVLLNFRPMRATTLIWMCLARVLELSDHLAHRCSRAQWQKVHDTITAWRDGWGDDARATYAQARFSTLTGLTRGRESRAEYMNWALVKALSVVHA